MSRSIALAVAATLLAACVAPASAQISPGPLSRAHQELEGITKCLKCHGLKGERVDAFCLDCHREIAWLRQEQRGLHGAGSPGECADCHLEHGGLDVELVHWGRGGPEAFDHARAGWSLDGKHAEAECRACHQERFRVGAVTTVSENGLSPHSWLGMETACIACHKDPHEARLGTECAQCHTTRDFKEKPATFDHDRTRYSLRGAHTEVRCASCHASGYEPAALPRFASCRDCHADPHGGEATLAGRAVDCESCHRVEGFRPSTYTVAQHAATRYPLEGRHARVACAECHGRGSDRDDAGAVQAAFRFRPAFTSCRDCHDDSHGGQLATRADRGACEACHQTAGFRPSLFTAEDHDRTRFPLEGRHADATCASCHGPERPGLPAVPAAEAIGSARVLLRFDALECTGCHRDPHDGRFAPGGARPIDHGCLGCHDASAFRPARVDVAAHRAFRFPLDGAHAAVPCFECHRELEQSSAESAAASALLLAATPVHLTFESKAKECRDCHQDHHGGQFASRPDGGACGACHGVDGFAPAAPFDHGEHSRFPLEGAHRKVACERCHPTGARTDGTEGVIYRPLAARRCEDCHVTSPPPLREGES